MIRTAITTVTATFLIFSVWAINLVSYHPPGYLIPLAPLSLDATWK